MTIFQELKRRGLIAQLSHDSLIEELLDNQKGVKFYIGFDATADSLHIGHMMQLLTMKRLQEAGHYPIALLGTATSLIGDPTGRTDLRKMLTPEQIAHNAEQFAKQMTKLVDFSEGKGEFVYNYDWFKDIKYIDFLRDVGKHFTVNKMLTAECFKSRMEKGLSFLEFNYMLLQSYDFLHLYREKGVKLQLGGDDQWSNILAGADLIRRFELSQLGENDDTGENSRPPAAFAMTFALLAAKSGKKMGKTEKGAIWLDAEKCSPFDFYQHFRNTDDGDVINHLKMMTFVPVEEIEEMERTLTGAALNSAKELLAFEMTKLVHGEEEAKKASEAAKSVFAGGGASENIPAFTLSEYNGGINILDLLVQTGLCGSKRDARTNVEQNAVSVAKGDNESKVTDVNAVIEIDDFVIVKKGKKNIVKAVKP